MEYQDYSGKKQVLSGLLFLNSRVLIKIEPDKKTYRIYKVIAEQFFRIPFAAKVLMLPYFQLENQFFGGDSQFNNMFRCFIPLFNSGIGFFGMNGDFEQRIGDINGFRQNV